MAIHVSSIFSLIALPRTRDGMHRKHSGRCTILAHRALVGVTKPKHGLVELGHQLLPNPLLEDEQIENEEPLRAVDGVQNQRGEEIGLDVALTNVADPEHTHGEEKFEVEREPGTKSEIRVMKTTNRDALNTFMIGFINALHKKFQNHLKLIWNTKILMVIVRPLKSIFPLEL